MPSYALSAIGLDRPGIVAALARVLFEQGCNVEDSSMTQLRGNFAVMLVLAAPGTLEAGALEDALRVPCAELGLTYTVRPVGDVAAPAHPSHTLTVYGADRPGILLGVTETIARAGVNICDLTSRLSGEPDAPVWVLMLELSVPSSADVLERDLRDAAASLGVDLTLRTIEEDVL